MRLDKNYKVRVNPKQSRKIQELVFGLGGKWNGGTDWVINEIIPFLYVTSGLVMTCDSKEQEYFGYASSENTEIQADDLIALLTDLSKSEESLVQDMELTSEFETEASEPKFKVGDKVYLFGADYIEEITKIIGANFYLAGADFDASVSIKEICHATTENYERLQATFPHIEFEQPPKELKGSDLCRAMLEKGWKFIPCYVSDDSDQNAIDHEYVDLIACKDHLFRNSINGYGHEYAVPFDPRTGEPLTEAVLDE